MNYKEKFSTVQTRVIFKSLPDSMRSIEHFITRTALLNPPSLILQTLESSINPKKSPPFHSGKTGKWKKHFADEHKKIFKEIGGDLLIKPGYEKNHDW